MKPFWLLKPVCPAVMVYTVLVCTQAAPMERDPLCWGDCREVSTLPASSFTLNSSRCSSKMCAQNPRAQGHPATSHHRFLQEGTVMPRGFSLFSAEVPPP